MTLPRVGDGGTSEDTGADGSLVERARNGDDDAFATIHGRYDRELNDFCTGLVRDPVAAADIVQHTFSVLAERIHTLRDTAKLRAWLYAVARHESYRHLRHASRTRPSGSIADRADPVHDVEDDALVDDLSDLRPLVSLAAQSLSARDRLLYDLHTVGRLERNEVAAAIGVRPAHAGVLVHRFEKTMARTVSALGVLRRNGGRCEAIDAMRPAGPAEFDQLARKRLVRHVERCATCATTGAAFTEAVLGRLRSLVPLAAAVLGAAGLGARSAPSTLDLDRASFRWRRDGFPSSGASSASKIVVAAGAAAVATALLVIPGTDPEPPESALIPELPVPTTTAASAPTIDPAGPTTSTPASTTTTPPSPTPDDTTASSPTSAAEPSVPVPPSPIRLVTPENPTPTTVPTAKPPATTTPPGPDSTPPTVGDLTSTNGLSGNPDHRKVWERRDDDGCDGNPTSTVISLAASDAGGVDRVVLTWDAMTFDGSTVMTDRGDGTWVTTLGDYPDDVVVGGAEFRQVLLNAYAYDLAGNVTNEKLSIFVIDCP